MNSNPTHTFKARIVNSHEKVGFQLTYPVRSDLNELKFLDLYVENIYWTVYNVASSRFGKFHVEVANGVGIFPK